MRHSIPVFLVCKLFSPEKYICCGIIYILNIKYISELKEFYGYVNLVNKLKLGICLEETLTHMEAPFITLLKYLRENTTAAQSQLRNLNSKCFSTS